MSVKNRFKELRYTLNLSQKKMAEDIDISYIMVQNYEYGKNPVSDSTLLKLRNKYNVNPDWLINGTGSMFLGSSKTIIPECIKLPYFKEVSAAAGSGALVYDENTVEYMSIHSTLIKITHSNDVSIINAVGDSMYPLIDNNDFIIIDCPPSLNMLTVNALTTANTVLVPIQCEYYALEGLSQLIHTIELVQKRLNPDLEIEGVVFTMYDARTNLSLQVVENVKGYLHQNIYKTIIPRNVRLAEAPSHGLPINLYDSRSAGAESYRLLAQEVLHKGEEEWQ